MSTVLRSDDSAQNPFARGWSDAVAILEQPEPALLPWLARHAAGVELSRGRLQLAVIDAAAEEAVWRPHVRHVPDARTYTRLHLDARLELWLICWTPAGDGGFHDHGGSRGAVAVVEGALRERLLAGAGGSPGGCPPPVAASRSAPATCTTCARPGARRRRRCTSTRRRWARWASTR